MTILGSNVRCVAALEHRDAIMRFYTEIFGARAVHPAPDLDVYAMDGDSHVGVYFVPAEQALTPKQHEAVGTWIELAVDDVDAIQAELERRSFAPLQYHDKEHAYFQAPGGQVFRLASR
ncbi:MAG: VOC family protein [Myxococcota bacterium]